MPYSNEEAYDMLLILGEVYSQLKDCGGNVVLIGFLTRETFFHVWLNESKMSFSLNITTQIRRSIREVRTAKILAST